MIIFEGTNAQETYRTQLAQILSIGEDVVCRGQPTKEILDVATVLKEPAYYIPHIVPGRYWSPWLAMSEALWILAGRRDIEPLLPYNKRAGKFSDDGYTLNGAYGYRIRDQLPKLVERLRADPNDRRGVVTIWREDDLWVQTKDPPCNDMLMFKIRQGALHMTVINRSNDLHWGLYAVNLPTFAVLQSYLAATLGVEHGTQTHLSNSLHIYTDHRWDITDRMLRQYSEPQTVSNYARPPFHHSEWTPEYEDLRALCSSILDGETTKHEMPFLAFAQDFLRAYRENGDLDGCRHAQDFQGWIQAGRAWYGRPGTNARPVRSGSVPAATGVVGGA